MKLDVDMGERLQPGAELAAGSAHTLGDRADQAVVAGQQRDDAIGLTELVLAQHNRPIPIQPHPMSLSPPPVIVVAPRRCGQKPSRPSSFGSCCQSLATLTRSSRYIWVPSSVSIWRRALVPTSLSRAPPRPMTIPFWLGRST